MKDKQVVDFIVRSLAAVKAAETPPALQEAAFTAAFTLLTGSMAEVALPSNAEGGAGEPRHQSAASSAGQTGSAMLDKIADGLGLTGAQVVHLFADKDGVPELKIKSSKLPSNKAAGARDIALLVMAARQLGGIDEYTDTEVLRNTAKYYGRFDSKHFAEHMKELDHCTMTANKSKKLTNPGIEDASELAKKYVSGPE
jgi:hypothetical protein